MGWKRRCFEFSQTFHNYMKTRQESLLVVQRLRVGSQDILFLLSQVVWVASETLGVGRAVDGELCVVVAFYEPPGNMEGSFGDNILRMGSAVRERKRKELKGFVPPPPGESYGNLSTSTFKFSLLKLYSSFIASTENLVVINEHNTSNYSRTRL